MGNEVGGEGKFGYGMASPPCDDEVTRHHVKRNLCHEMILRFSATFSQPIKGFVVYGCRRMGMMGLPMRLVVMMMMMAGLTTGEESSATTTSTTPR